MALQENNNTPNGYDQEDHIMTTTKMTRAEGLKACSQTSDPAALIALMDSGLNHHVRDTAFQKFLRLDYGRMVAFPFITMIGNYFKRYASVVVEVSAVDSVQQEVPVLEIVVPSASYVVPEESEDVPSTKPSGEAPNTDFEPTIAALASQYGESSEKVREVFTAKGGDLKKVAASLNAIRLNRVKREKKAAVAVVA